MLKVPKLPNISESEKTPIVSALLEIIQYQSEVIQALKDEVAGQKGLKKKPKIRPSGIEKKIEEERKSNKKTDQQRAGSAKRSKTKQLQIHETKVVEATGVPKGSVFKGYKSFVVQGLEISTHNIEYKMARWQLPDGTYVCGQLPQEIRGHFSAELLSFILYQYYQCHVTQPLLLEQLREYGVEISAGQLDVILTEGHEDFHKEKDSILTTGLKISSYVQADDTGARHKGANGFCTHIGNEFFAWFGSTNSKSRVNFLKLLSSLQEEYHLTEEAFSYMRCQKFPKNILNLLLNSKGLSFKDSQSWESFLEGCGIVSDRHCKIATEGALIGGLLSNGLNPDLVILSDDAGQFNILLHALCWVHAERTIYKLIGFNEEQKEALENIRGQVWDFYRDLKSYKENPSVEFKQELKQRFDVLFREQTCFVSLNLALKRIYENKEELLLVLERPEIPIHNNASESDIREYAKRRKVSGGTRSDLGRKSRDTFTSLKKTCRKLGLSYWRFLNDRLSLRNQIPQLSQIMIEKVSTA